MRFVQDRWEAGTEAWFEYHCWESDQSSDADLWHRSHERVTVLEHVGPEGHDPCFRDEAPMEERDNPCMYRVRFHDGWEHDVFEDEILTSTEGYERPDPPKLVLTPG